MLHFGYCTASGKKRRKESRKNKKKKNKKNKRKRTECEKQEYETQNMKICFIKECLNVLFFNRSLILFSKVVIYVFGI